MIERLLIAIAVLIACAGTYLLLQVYLSLRQRALLSSAPETDTSVADGATLVYFSTAECGRCRDQSRAIASLELRLGERVRVQKVDALAEPDLAERYGVLTVPTTVVLDGATRPRAVNYGFAPEGKLEAQLRQVLSGAALAA